MEHSGSTHTFSHGSSHVAGGIGTLLAASVLSQGRWSRLFRMDFKFIIGYSSVSHMGFVVLGLLATTETGLSGAVLQMFSHGIIAGLLFAVVGRMVYARAHTRVLKELQWMNLRAQLPFASTLFLLAGLASIGLLVSAVLSPNYMCWPVPGKALPGLVS